MTRAFALNFEVRRGDLPRLNERLLNLSEGYPAAFREALFEESTYILEAAKTYVPVLTGRLRRSGRAYQSSARSPRVNVQFLASYALVVHETHRTKAKYLERALNEALPGMARRLARRIVEIES